MADVKHDYFETEKLDSAIQDSDAWLLVRVNKEGLHMHWKDKDSISLLPLMLANNPELWDFVKTAVWDIKKQNKK